MKTTATMKENPSGRERPLERDGARSGMAHDATDRGREVERNVERASGSERETKQKSVDMDFGL